MGKPTPEQSLNRAHELWEQNGKPDGREDEFYFQAERELREADERGDPAKESPDDIQQSARCYAAGVALETGRVKAGSKESLSVPRRNLKFHQRHRSQCDRIALALVGTSKNRFREGPNMA